MPTLSGILSTMYFDINSLLIFQNIVQNVPDYVVMTVWQNQIDDTKDVVHPEVLTAVEKYQKLENAAADKENGLNRLYQL
ncbi:hypothetical protein N7508_002059 [Penicillium antarcticum]|uniref:uncharacterized protein n=1 Tax=Penicillium antarcticum TaxID=416450 RepID=UPI0023A3C832|nr:uncharacterized protein N7508_002059 [Penicillium antarcticum]KAJ5317551.1 hypothetical protein N7508_002059 [Penicillium antarcticum]